jgi:methionyl-tRNA formyltransferase
MTAVDDLRIVFMGSPAFVVPVLDAAERFVAGQGGSIVAVYAAPDRPAGRGRAVQPSPIKRHAEAKGIPVLTPARLTNTDETERFLALKADLVVLAAYGRLLPEPFLFAPRHGAINVHPSLLPRHRGAAPVQAAILAGDAVTGTTIMKMDEGLDTGPVLAMRNVALDGRERAPELTERLFALGASMLEETLPAYLGETLLPVAQASEGMTVVKRFSKADSGLDWSNPAAELERQVRAFDAWPGSATLWEGRRIEILEAEVGSSGMTSLPPGHVIDLHGGLAVGTGDGLLVLQRVRLEGGQATTARDFLRGHPKIVGTTLSVLA